MENNHTNEAPVAVPFAAYEVALAHSRENSRRLFWALLAAIAVILITNLGWMWAWMQYDYVSDTVTIESTAGHANFIGANGDIYNGENPVQEAG